jgi:hypothetical protein
MFIPGVVALIAASPFWVSLLGGEGGPSGFPISFEVRKFIPILFYPKSLSSLEMNLRSLLLLPVNYFFELGFFFVVGILWFRKYRQQTTGRGFLETAETILLAVTFLTGSFVRSRFGENDLGWRVWLLGQFVLLIWGVDFFREMLERQKLSEILAFWRRKPFMMRFLSILMVVGISTSLLDLILLRIWPMLVDANVTSFPEELSPDANLGLRTYSARQAYEYIYENVPEDTIVQYNPARDMDRPAGLYGSHQMAIADITAYGVSPETLLAFRQGIEAIFVAPNSTDWQAIDLLCSQYSIDVIIVNDTDPLWQSLSRLSVLRLPLYQNDHYAVYACGKQSS